MALAFVRNWVSLPAPSGQPTNCSGGGDLIITLKSRKTITYGPCRWPWQISELWGAMIQTADLTETGGPLPDLSAKAELEHVRRTFWTAFRPIGRRRFAPVAVAWRGDAHRASLCDGSSNLGQTGRSTQLVVPGAATKACRWSRRACPGSGRSRDRRVAWSRSCDTRSGSGRT
jgi:hypothetical protein